MAFISRPVEALGDHDYLVRFKQDEDTVVVRVHADPAVVAQIADDEQRVVEATAAYLIARQSADDLPEHVDLDAVAAAYDGYVEDRSTACKCRQHCRLTAVELVMIASNARYRPHGCPPEVRTTSSERLASPRTGWYDGYIEVLHQQLAPPTSP